MLGTEEEKRNEERKNERGQAKSKSLPLLATANTKKFGNLFIYILRTIIEKYLMEWERPLNPTITKRRRKCGQCLAI